MSTQKDNPDKRTEAAEQAAMRHNAVTVPEDKLIELQHKAKLVDELLLELEQARIDIFYYGNSDFNKTIKNIDKAIAKAKGE